MKAIEEIERTDNPGVYRKAKRTVLDAYEGICSFCKIHRGENRSRPIRNWKNYRKTQYRSKEME